MFCLICNTQNSVSAVYCDGCGEPLRPGENTENPFSRLKPNERHLESERNWRDF